MVDAARALARWGVILAVWTLLACSGEAGSEVSVTAPAHVENPVSESELALVHLSAAAMSRIGLATARVVEGDFPQRRLLGGEVVIPPGRTFVVAAPVAGVVRVARPNGEFAPGSAVRRGEVLFRLVPIAPAERDVQARVSREIAAAQATLDVAERRAERQRELAQERAGSARTLDDALVARDVAAADLAMARARGETLRRTPMLADVGLVVRAPGDGIVRLLSAADGQAVGAGALLVEIVAVDALQIRVPVYAGDLARLDATQPARVERLSAAARPEATASATFEAHPSVGPPTSEPDRLTVDRYFVAPPLAGVVPGERVFVSIALAGTTHERAVPASAIVLDAQGSAWVYECPRPGTFRRARIDPTRRAGDAALFTRGPEVGTCIVAVGAAEVFGSEFEPGH